MPAVYRIIHGSFMDNPVHGGKTQTIQASKLVLVDA